MIKEKIDILNNGILYDTCIKIINQFEKESLNNILKKKELYLEKVSFIRDNKNGSNIYDIKIIDPDRLRMCLLGELDKWNEKTHLEYFFYLIKSNDFFNFNDQHFTKSFNKSPSIISNILINFIIRVIELEKIIFKINNITFHSNSINKAYDELIKNLMNKKFNYVILVQLFGVTGDINEISVENIKIKKINQSIADIFNVFRYNKQSFHFISTGGYYMEIHQEIDKENYMTELNNKTEIINKSFKLIALSGNGNIKKGNILLKSHDWTIKREFSRSFEREFLYKDNEYLFILDDKIKKNIEKNYELICLDSDNSELYIKKSIERLLNSKLKNNIEDKIIELALALEYSLITDIKDIQKTLKKKSKLLYQVTSPEKTSKEIQDIIFYFYSLRSDIIHGLNEIENSHENIEKVANAEEIIRSNILFLLRLNQNYSLELINEVLNETSIKISKSLKNILDYPIKVIDLDAKMKISMLLKNHKLAFVYLIIHFKLNKNPIKLCLQNYKVLKKILKEKPNKDIEEKKIYERLLAKDGFTIIEE